MLTPPGFSCRLWQTRSLIPSAVSLRVQLMRTATSRPPPRSPPWLLSPLVAPWGRACVLVDPFPSPLFIFQPLHLQLANHVGLLLHLKPQPFKVENPFPSFDDLGGDDIRQIFRARSCVQPPCSSPRPGHAAPKVGTCRCAPSSPCSRASLPRPPGRFVPPATQLGLICTGVEFHGGRLCVAQAVLYPRKVPC